MATSVTDLQVEARARLVELGLRVRWESLSIKGAVRGWLDGRRIGAVWRRGAPGCVRRFRALYVCKNTRLVNANLETAAAAKLWLLEQVCEDRRDRR